jgi:hypothetical protein
MELSVSFGKVVPTEFNKRLLFHLMTRNALRSRPRTPQPATFLYKDVVVPTMQHCLYQVFSFLWSKTGGVQKADRQVSPWALEVLQWPLLVPPDTSQDFQPPPDPRKQELGLIPLAYDSDKKPRKVVFYSVRYEQHSGDVRLRRYIEIPLPGDVDRPEIQGRIAKEFIAHDLM